MRFDETTTYSVTWKPPMEGRVQPESEVDEFVGDPVAARARFFETLASRPGGKIFLSAKEGQWTQTIATADVALLNAEWLLGRVAS